MDNGTVILEVWPRSVTISLLAAKYIYTAEHKTKNTFANDNYFFILCTCHFLYTYGMP